MTSVNTPLKPPTSTKDGQQSNGLPGRKISISNQGITSGGYGLSSPTTARGPGRRRETSESYPFPSNPLASSTATFDRGDQRTSSPPPSLQRRRTDLRDGNRGGESEDKATSSPFGTLKRNPTGPLSAGLGGPSSPWSHAPPSAGLSPMGSFGNFPMGQMGQPDKRAGLGSGRTESKFKSLLNKDSIDETSFRSGERKSSLSGSMRPSESDSWRAQQPFDLGGATLEEAEEDLPSGSAALASDADISLPQHSQAGLRGFGTPGRSDMRDELNFGTFGMTSENAPGFGHGFAQQTPSHHRQMGGNEPMSPTDTNPYQSPEQRGTDNLMQTSEGDGSDPHSAQLPGLGGYGGESQPFGGMGMLSGLPNLGRAGGAPASDRSQTSSAGAGRAFPGLGGLGQLGGVPGVPGWPASHGGLGTPTRSTAGLSNAFGGGIFATSTGEMQSPGLAGLGGMRGSRMSSMFPSAMQDQLRSSEQERDLGPDRSGYQQFMGQMEQLREDDRSFGEPQQPRNEMDNLLEEGGQFGAPGQASLASGQGVQQPSSAQGPMPQPPSSASNQPPPPQQRTMVMPDRMRWIYRDPQGQTQGPWSGLEMHDWYKAGFFSPELLVKKYEDADYEPLAQLIRRIGNSREPFLVPQIGIPHGAPSNNGPNAWAGSGPPPAAPGGAQPPFANSFPSFGTTLTAEQQNALERRKQEEQYLMARQKEHLAQQQMAQRMHIGNPAGAPTSHSGLMPQGGQLHHHGSTQSLHSQPSFGSMTSPTAGPFQPSPLQAPQNHQPGFFDNSFRSPGQGGGVGAVGAGVDDLGHIREEEIPGIMDRLNQGTRGAAGQFGAPGQPLGAQQQMQSQLSSEHDAQVQQMLQDRARLQQEQAQNDPQQPGPGAEQFASGERMRQFQQLQGQAANTGIDARFQAAMGKLEMSEEESSGVTSSIGSPEPMHRQHTPPQVLTLTEQVQKAASVQQSPVQPQPGLPQPFPPAPSQSPLPAPAAQRTGRQSVADQLQTEQRDLSQTPSTETPSATVAPWAKDSTEAMKGPSLKEIQEMESRKAAEADEIISAQRRAALQKQMETQAQAATIAPAPGLPASASWAAAQASSGTAAGGISPWAKAAQKPAATTLAKTMAQIQKEEEARKRRLAAAAASAQAAVAGPLPSPAGGKSYANLAGKVSGPTGPGNTAWTTVGASGKTKTPVAAPAPAAARSVSSGIVPTLQAPASAAARKPPTRFSTMNNPGAINAQEEFRKWAVGELRPDLNKGIPGKSTDI